jgi:hypothetical protein
LWLHTTDQVMMHTATAMMISTGPAAAASGDHCLKH